MRWENLDDATIKRYNRIHSIISVVAIIPGLILPGLMFSPILLIPCLLSGVNFITIIIGALILGVVGLINFGLLWWLIGLDEKYDLFPPEPQPKSTYDLYGQDASIWD